MVLVRTHDGNIGWKKEGKMRWFDTEFKAKMWAAATWDFNDDELKDFEHDFKEATEQLSRSGHVAAFFGVMGGFMYTESEVE